MSQFNQCAAGTEKGTGMQAMTWIGAMSLALLLGQSAFAMCPIPAYITDANDLVQIKGKLYDNAGNETKVSCTPADANGIYRAYTGGFSSPPARAFELIHWLCPTLDEELDHPFGAAGADVQISKNGTPMNVCAFVGQLNAGSGYPNGFYVSSLLKFDPVGGFKSEKGTLIYNLTSGSFIGKFKVVAKP